MALVEDPQHGADQQEDEEKGEDDHRAQGERFPAVGDALAGQHPLHDQLLRAMGGEHEDGAAEDSHPDIEGRSEQELGK